MSDITLLLEKIEQGDAQAPEQLLPLVYDELRKLASAKLAHEKPGLTLQATALVHEAYLRIVDVDYSQRWNSRKHFFGAAAEAMRRILTDRARRLKRKKHGGDLQRVELDAATIVEPADRCDLESLDAALEKFAKADPTACQLVKLRYFTGLSIQEASEILEISPRTADRLWAYAKAWLLSEMQSDRVSSDSQTNTAQPSE
ncbi:MAG: hypothetical protein RIS70_2989 [Planctomycetota bacterium]|jgi:RNA polymerase sigma factor (TIGR02999 family)